MKRPDPKACARIAANIREFCAVKRPSYLLLDDELTTVRDALEFCAREPDGYVIGLDSEVHRDYESVPRGTRPEPGEKLYTCYRIDETEGE